LGEPSAAAFECSSALSSLGVFDKLVLAAGTGFHEEFLFRALLIPAAARLLARCFG